MNKRIKVVWLCHFSNGFVHDKLHLGDCSWKKILRKILHKPLITDVSDFAVWITNGIREFEKINEVELHIVSPYPYLKTTIEEFDANGIHYHFFHNEDELLSRQLKAFLFYSQNNQYKRNRKSISRIISKIKPDIVHIFGVENSYYSLSIFDIPRGVITIAQLQTLLNDSDIIKQTPTFFNYQYRTKVEAQIIRKTDYVGTRAVKYRNIIKNSIDADAIILNTGLALFEPIRNNLEQKQFDFVYFAANISKAADLAIEAFGIACKQNPNISLDIIGSCDNDFKKKLDDIIQRYGINKQVVFEGLLDTHDDVLNQIRKARFALLPVRADLTSGTIREAMSNGIPVITTDTGDLGTRKLNLKRQNVLISPIGDHTALADNMLRLLNDDELAETLRQNAYQTRAEARSNKIVAQEYVQTYKACLENYRNGTPLPEEIVNI